MLLFYSTKNERDSLVKSMCNIVKRRIYALMIYVVVALGYLKIDALSNVYSSGSVLFKQKMKLVAGEFYKALCPYLIGSVLPSSFMLYDINCFYPDKKYGHINEEQVAYLKKRYSYKKYIDPKEKAAVFYYSIRNGRENEELFCLVILGIDQNEKDISLCFFKQEGLIECVKKIPLTQVSPGFIENDPPEKKQEDKQELLKEEPVFVKRTIIIGIFLFCAGGLIYLFFVRNEA